MGIEAVFETADCEGASLRVEPYARRGVMEPNREIEEYLLKYHRLWYDVALSEKRRIRDPSDIVFVTGWVKTSQWAMAVFRAKERSRGGKFKAFLSLGQLGLKWVVREASNVLERTTEGPFATQGGVSAAVTGDQVDQLETPSPSSTPHCISVSYYKVKYRFFNTVRTLKAGAGPGPLPEPDRETERGEGVPVSPDHGPDFHGEDFEADVGVDFEVDRTL